MPTPTLQAFPIDTDEELATFERYLSDYVCAITGFNSLRHYSLARVKQTLLDDANGARLFTALVDLRISMALLEQHTVALGKLFNRTLPNANDDPFQPIPYDAFRVRMEIHDHANAFVLRFRSIWDKVMGILVLRFSPGRYDTFCHAKSKKSAFRKIFASSAVIPTEFVRTAEEVIRQFDDAFRTPEAHGTGSLRKLSFTWVDPRSSPPLNLLGYWNFLNEISHLLGGIFDPRREQDRISEN